MIRYELCDQRGWDVGSGPMESMCGVTTDRIKGRGRRWDNAGAMMGLEAAVSKQRTGAGIATGLMHLPIGTSSVAPIGHPREAQRHEGKEVNRGASLCNFAFVLRACV